MAFWEVTYNGVTKDASAWGISGLKRKRRVPVSTDVVTFKLDGMAFDTSPLPFAYLRQLSITRNGVPWFSGIVTQSEPKGSARSESVDYEISSPWYWLEKTMFQQQWTQLTADGAGFTTGTTTQSETILGQSLNGVKLNSGQVILEVLRYAQYAYQMVPFPAMVDVNNLPPAPPANTPFQIGQITPSIVVPYMSVRDKSCADIIRQMMKYSPDAVAWFNYETSPPTLNIGQRPNLAARTISVLNGAFKLVNSFNPTPRYDLQVPCVVAKFQESNEANGESLSTITVQVYPPAPPGVNAEAWASQPRAWVQTLDLVGGHTTIQSADIKTLPRPVNKSDTAAMSWFLRKNPDLTATLGVPYVNAGQKAYDTDKMVVDFVNTVIDADDPLNDPNQNPNNISIGTGSDNGDCPQLVNELLTGEWPSWLQEDPNNVDTAKVGIEMHIKYPGTDPATKALFWQDPTNPNNVLTDGSGVYIFYWKGKVTNASTQVYSRLTSWSAGEPVPAGFAEYLYNCLAPLHFSGELIMIEEECSDLLPPGCVFNTTDGSPDWKTMNALVLSVDEDIDSGTTKVKFGPPAFLNLEEMEQLFRANLGVLPAYKLTQRTTGKLTAGSNVIGARHAADTHVIKPALPPAPRPWGLSFQRVNGVLQCKVYVNSTIYNPQGTPGTLPGTGLDSWFTCTPGVSGGDAVWIEGTIVSLACTAWTIKSIGQGNTGSTDYDPTGNTASWDASGKGDLVNDGGTPPNQTLFRRLIGTITADNNGNPIVNYSLNTNLVLSNKFVAGPGGSEPCIYVEPYGG